jgi:hypothetical protein
MKYIPENVESAIATIEFAHIGKFCHKLFRLEKQQNTSLPINAPKISPYSRTCTRIDSASLVHTLFRKIKYHRFSTHP